MRLTQLKVGVGAIVVAAATAIVVQHQRQQQLHNEPQPAQTTQLKNDNQIVADTEQARQQSAAQTGEDRAYLNAAKQGVVGVMVFAGDNQDRFPTNIDQVRHYVGGSGPAANLNQFEIVYHGTLSSLTNLSTILIRSQPWQSNGEWHKAYGFADGHCEVHAVPDGDFDQWEQQVQVFKDQ